MVTVTAKQVTKEQGLRYLDPTRDLGEVADLLEEAFAGQLEPGGEHVLREMRFFAHVAPWLGGLVFGPGTYGTAVVGFVWLEQGHIVGHATVQRLDFQGRRWQIANVAVQQDYRGRGIGRALMEAALDHVHREGGTWAVLQVRAHNAPALHLYRSLGFETVTTEVRWVMEVTSQVVWPSSPFARPGRYLGEGQRASPLRWQHSGELHSLMGHALTEGGRWWWEGRKADDLLLRSERMVDWLLRQVGIRRLRRLGIWDGDRLVAAVGACVHRWRRSGELSLFVHRDHWGRWERLLLQHALSVMTPLHSGEVTVLTEAGHEPLGEVLQAVGFRRKYQLVDMRKRV